MTTTLRTTLTCATTLVSAFLLGSSATGAGPKFLPSDPRRIASESGDAAGVQRTTVNPMASGWQTVHGAARRAGRAADLNSIGEVPDSSWFTNRIEALPISAADVERGPDRLLPSPSGPWIVTAGKSDGVTPGLRLRDAAGRLFYVKFDPPVYAELSSGAEVVSTKLLHAIGYWVPENYIAILRRDELSIAPGAKFTRPDGPPRAIVPADIDRVLSRAARNPDGSYRVLASLAVEGKPIGPFRYTGTRLDDPNDTIPHEERRELRALRVFAAWMNHVDTKAQNSLDAIVDASAGSRVRHYLIDFGSTLGSAGTEPKDWRDGNEYAFEPRTATLALLTLGARTPSWLRIHYPDLPSVGRFEARHFDPERWKPTLRNPAFDRADAEDLFWAAERVTAFTDGMVRAAVASAQFSDPRAARYLGDVLIERRDRIGRAWLTSINPVANPSIDADGRLAFKNVALERGATLDRPTYRTRCSVFDNVSRVATPLEPWVPSAEPHRDITPVFVSSSDYLMVEIATMHPNHPRWAAPVRAFFHYERDRSWRLVGFERLLDQ